MRVLAVASRGGHWVQLRRLRPALEEFDVTYVTTDPAYREEVDDEHAFVAVPDANRQTKVRLLLMMLQIAKLVVTKRPQVIVSTGAAPGYFAIRLGKLIGAKTVWLDSIANAERMSMSGQRIQKHADLWLTQWNHVASRVGAKCLGSVL
ncbi:MAG: UDP-N-acetylglucosamine--LPS N-acetylglucosamine transferase [Planctomycetota bacterium]